MEKGFIKVIKVKYSFQDGNEVSGIELNLAPKVKKFIQMNSDNIELMNLIGNGLADWYNRVDYGDDLDLTVYTGKDKLVTNNGQVPVNFI